MKNRSELITALRSMWMTKQPQCLEIYINVVNEGRITNTDIQNLFNNAELLNNASDVVLLWLYEPLVTAFTKLKPLDYFFTKEEIIEAHESTSVRKQTKFPIRFPILSKLRSNSYLSCLSIQQILSLKEAGVIRWKDKMQRETVYTKIGDTLVSHIKYDDKRAREIGQKMIAGDFYPNSFRWHIVSADCEYDITDDTIILKDGYIAEIDGQHRDKGSEYALTQNPDIEMSVPIIFTIGNSSLAQAIINQDEQRAPIDKHVVESYKQTATNRIVKWITASDELDPVYKFGDTEQSIKIGGGFVLVSTLADAIDKYYNTTKMSYNTQKYTAHKITCFLNELADIFQEEFTNYRQLQISKSTIISDQMIDTYVYIISVVQDDNEPYKKFRSVITSIDFNLPLKQISSHEYIDQLIKG